MQTYWEPQECNPNWVLLRIEMSLTVGLEEQGKRWSLSSAFDSRVWNSCKVTNYSIQLYFVKTNLLVIFEIVQLAAIIHKIFPLFAMFTSCIDEYIFVVVQMMKGVASFTSDSVNVSFAFKNKQIFGRSNFFLLDNFQTWLFLLNCKCLK